MHCVRPRRNNRKNATDAKTQKRENHADKTAKNPLKKTANRRIKNKLYQISRYNYESMFYGLGLYRPANSNHRR